MSLLLCALSNFYETDIVLGEHTFPSLEHAYQARRFQDVTEWLKGGKYSDWDWVLKRVNEARTPISAERFKSQRFVGVLASFVAERPLMFDLKLKEQAPETPEAVWMPLFEAKFKGDLLRQLMNTRGTLLGIGHRSGGILTKFRESKRPRPCGLGSASGIVLTWSHSVESGNYVKPVGRKGRGFNLQDLKAVMLRTGGILITVQGKYQEVTGHVLVVRGFIPERQRLLMVREVMSLPNYDTMGWFRGKCLRKSRWNFQLTDRDVAGNIPEPNKDLRRSCEAKFDRAPACAQLRDTFTSMGIRDHLDTIQLKAEGNIYGITKQGGKPPSIAPGIGPHVDGERNTVIATNLMGTRQLCLCPYYHAQPIGPRTQITIYPGDMYIFDTVAAGSSIRGHHIRHWASGGRGDYKYIQSIERQLVKKLKKFKGPLSEDSKHTLKHGQKSVRFQ